VKKIKWYAAIINLSEKKINETLDVKNVIEKKFGKNISSYKVNEENIIYELASNRNELKPLTHTNDYFVFGDIDVHNTQKLKEIFSDTDSINWSTEQLIIELYKLEGISFIGNLKGTFSFVLFDKQKSEVYIIRDQIGIKPIFWKKHNEKLYISSDIFLLIDNEANELDLNMNYFSEFVQSNGIVDTVNTPYKNIYRIPSGSVLNYTAITHSLKKYWNMSDIKEESLIHDSKYYVNKFDEIFNESVKRRLKKDEKNTGMLSGGLDSTSIYAVAKEHSKIETTSIESVSAVFEELVECDESYFIDGLLEKYDSKGLKINFDNKLMFEDFPHSIPQSDEPSVNEITYNFTSPLISHAINSGSQNILSGFAGDHLLSGSAYTAADKIREKKYKDAFKIITEYSIRSNSSAFKNFKDYVLFPNSLKEHFPKKSSLNKSLEYNLNKIKKPSKQELYIQLTQAKSHLYTDRIIGGFTGADIQYPFLDQDLIEFIFKVPSDLLFDGSKKKVILRESMNNRLTEDILSRENKTRHVTHTYKSLRNNWSEIYEVLSIGYVSKTFNLISSDEWINELAKWRNGLPTDNRMWTLLAIEIWMNKVVSLGYKINWYFE